MFLWISKKEKQKIEEQSEKLLTEVCEIKESLRFINKRQENMEDMLCLHLENMENNLNALIKQNRNELSNIVSQCKNETIYEIMQRFDKQNEQQLNMMLSLKNMVHSFEEILSQFKDDNLSKYDVIHSELVQVNDKLIDEEKRWEELVKQKTESDNHIKKLLKENLHMQENHDVQFELSADTLKNQLDSVLSQSKVMNDEVNEQFKLLEESMRLLLINSVLNNMD